MKQSKEIESERILWWVFHFALGGWEKASMTRWYLQGYFIVLCFVFCNCFFTKLRFAGNWIFFSSAPWMQGFLPALHMWASLEIAHSRLWVYLVISLNITASLNATYIRQKLYSPSTSVKLSFIIRIILISLLCINDIFQFLNILHIFNIIYFLTCSQHLAP